MKKKCCDHTLSSDMARDLLNHHKMNRTKVKIGALVQLSKAKSPLSVAELHQKLKEHCDVSTVFRTIAQFKEKGLVKELNLGEEFFRYELLDPKNTQTHHHHHIRCRQCGDIKLIEKCDIEVFEKMIGRLGFKNMEHYLEFTGICSSCS